jgi:Secretion system C-terminal sorting domain/IPT/TIG domain
MKIRLFLISAVLLFFFQLNSVAQCNMYELPLAQKVSNSTTIFEGKVISKNYFWDTTHHLIFTSNIIDVYKVFKGNLASTTVEIITEGGTINNYMQTVEPNIELKEGDVGIFMTEPSTHQNPLNTTNIFALQCYGGSQGFFKYDILNKTASVPFRKYDAIQTQLIDIIKSISHETVKYIHLIDPFQQNTTTNQSIPKSGGSITGFTPTTITGGTYSILTINGAGFGATRGGSNVLFRNPDDGGASYKKAFSGQYVSWSDTQIQVKVPAKAGTGTIQVVIGTNIYTSAGTLTVNYAEINTTDTVNPYQTEILTLNPAGNIIWQMYTGFDSNIPAKNSFDRALKNWSDNTNINWSVGATTTKNSIGFDSVNVVRFDIGNELPAGTLARCYYYWYGCGGGNFWFVSELDMAVDDGTAWEFGPAAPTGALYDFESVMLHELGHGHQLSHVIDPLDVMHYSTVNGVSKRILNTNNIAAGKDIMSRSAIGNNCAHPYLPMILGIKNNQTNQGALIAFPNPTSGILTVEIPAGELISAIDVFNPYGGLVYSIHPNYGSKQVKIDLSNLSNGVYYVVANSETKTFTNSIVLTK